MRPCCQDARLAWRYPSEGTAFSLHAPYVSRTSTGDWQSVTRVLSHTPQPQRAPLDAIWALEISSGYAARRAERLCLSGDCLSPSFSRLCRPPRGHLPIAPAHPSREPLLPTLLANRAESYRNRSSLNPVE